MRAALIIFGVATAVGFFQCTRMLAEIATNTATMVQLLELEELDLCDCEDDEVCDSCRLPFDDAGFSLGDSDEQNFLDIVENYDEGDLP